MKMNRSLIKKLKTKKMKILIYGYGNPGRQDDGLGIKMAELIEEWAKAASVKDVETESNYQLNIEDAEKISGYDLVIFVDASQERDLANFVLEEVRPVKDKIEFTMHAVSPGYILYLAKELFGAAPEVKVLKIKGYEWDFKEGLSPSAVLNLERAFQFLICKLKNRLELDIPTMNIKC
jgi:hydrogenase maturation protease